MKEDGELIQTMPKYKWEMAQRYHEVLMTSMSVAILASKFADGEVDEADSEDEEDSGDENDEVEEYQR